MDLETMIDQTLAALPRGRRGNPRAAPSYAGDIEPEELPRILASPAPPPSERPLQRIRHSHHLAAKLIAEGRALVEVAGIVGLTPARIGQLRRDPAFAELEAFYKTQTDGKWLNVHERLAALGVSVTEEIQQRLEEDPEAFTNEELRRLAETTLDRGGYGPKSTRDINVRSQSLSVSLIEQIKAEGRDSGQVKLLEDQNDAG